MTQLTITSLDSEPLLTDFVPLQEYRSSAPAGFSLEESPVLYFSAEGLVLESKKLYRLFRNRSLARQELEAFQEKCEKGVLVNVKVVST